MLRFSAIAVVLLWAGPYQGPINGDKRDNGFSFSHLSDWKKGQIENTVQNEHKVDSLIVDWAKGGIIRGQHRPIPPGSSDVNRYACPEALLTADYRAKLFFGLSHNSKVAGVYEFKSQKQIPAVLKSEITLGAAEGEPYQLEVISTFLGTEVVYSFIQNRYFDISLELSGETQKDFSTQGWDVQGNAMQIIQRIEAITERKADDDVKLDLQKYQLLSPKAPTIGVKVTARNFQPNRNLVVLSDREKVFIGTGFITLHVPLRGD